jgi:hypothetical protein
LDYYFVRASDLEEGRKEINNNKNSDWIGTLDTPPQLIFFFSRSARPLSITYPSTHDGRDPICLLSFFHVDATTNLYQAFLFIH